MNTTLETITFASGQVFKLVHGDLMVEPVDAIVNAANEQLQHGGGIAGVIARVGGPTIDRESRAWVQEHGPVSHQRPAYTSGGDLPMRYVIHAVGPVWGSGDENARLAAAIDGSLQVAAELELVSLGFPAISTGIFGFPKVQAAGVIYQAVQDYYSANPESAVQTVHVTVHDTPTATAFHQVWQTFFSQD